MMMHCERCGSRRRCPSCNGTGMHATKYPSGTTVPTSCAQCWGTGLKHDPTKHPDPEREADEPRASGWAGADR